MGSIAKRIMVAAALAGVGSMVAHTAVAQVTYRPIPPTSHGFPLYPYSDQSPYAQEFGERPSFEILPQAYGYGPAVRVVPRCLYPNGWNVTDFDRDVNGIPPGIDHQCPAPAGLRTRY